MITHKSPSKKSGKYEMSSSSGTESRTVIHDTRKLLVNGLMTNILSERRGTKCARENAFFTAPNSLESSGYETTIPRLCSSICCRTLSGSANCGTYTEADSATISFNKRSRSSAPFFTESSGSAASLEIINRHTR